MSRPARWVRPELDPGVLQDFIEGRGLSHKKNSVSFIFDCPRCAKKDKLYLRRRDGQFVCWFCRERSKFFGRAEYALSELASMPLAQVREALFGPEAQGEAGPSDLGVEEFLDEDFAEEDFMASAEDEIPAVAWPLDYYELSHQHAARGREYLEGRGIPASIAETYGIRYCPVRKRVAFPIALRGRLLGWQERLVVDNRSWDDEDGKWIETPKILSSKGIPRDRVVMFADRLDGQRHAVLTEGPVDALKAHLCGGNVAAMGKVVSQGQVDLLRSHGLDRVYLALDPDASDEIERLLGLFSDVECYGLFAPEPYKDLGAMPMEAVLDAYLCAPLLNPGTLIVYMGN